MVKYCMAVIQKVVHKVNSWQIPKITADQPVYALLKQIHENFQMVLIKLCSLL